jgi:hypothetical protein
MGPEIVVPVAIFGSIVLGIWIVMHFMTKRRAEAYATMRLAIEKGQVISPEAMEAMVRTSSPFADLRKGIVFIAISLAFGVLGTLIGSEEPEALRPMLGVASFPLFIGLAFLGLHFFANEKKQR